jgi:hypothetical protein
VQGYTIALSGVIADTRKILQNEEKIQLSGVFRRSLTTVYFDTRGLRRLFSDIPSSCLRSWLLIDHNKGTGIESQSFCLFDKTRYDLIGYFGGS